MSVNPYLAPNEPFKAATGPSNSNSGLYKCLIGGGIVIVVLLLLLPNIRSAREPARRMACSNNLKQLALALHNYESRNGGLPPAFTVAPDGTRLHSWRALLLPYLEEESIYESIDFSRPWDDPVNAQAFAKCPQVFRCTSHELSEGYSNYLAIVGPDRCFHPTESRTFAEITDGLSTTLMVIEISPEQAVHWMSPHDAEGSIAALIGAQSVAPHFGGRNAVRADGSIFFLSDKIPREDLQALETIAADDGGWERYD